MIAEKKRSRQVGKRGRLVLRRSEQATREIFW
jgi:hypothetical protein